MARMRQEASPRIAVVAAASRWDVTVAGDLDLHSGRELVDVARVLAAYRAPAVGLDLAEVGFVDTAGWRAVERALAVLARAGTAAAVVRCSEPVHRFRALFAEVAADAGATRR